MVRLLFGGGYTDLCYGYNAFWRRVVPRLALDGDGFEIETMMNVRALKIGLRVAEVPSFESHRIHGESNLHTIPDGMRVLRTIVRERLSGPIRAVPPMPTPIVMLPVTRRTRWRWPWSATGSPAVGLERPGLGRERLVVRRGAHRALTAGDARRRRSAGRPARRAHATDRVLR